MLPFMNASGDNLQFFLDEFQMKNNSFYSPPDSERRSRERVASYIFTFQAIYNHLGNVQFILGFKKFWQLYSIVFSPLPSKLLHKMWWNVITMTAQVYVDKTSQRLETQIYQRLIEGSKMKETYTNLAEHTVKYGIIFNKNFKWV